MSGLPNPTPGSFGLRQLVGEAKDSGLSTEELATELEEQAPAMRQCLNE